MMLNVVADMEGAGAAVLIRSCSPVSGEHCSIAHASKHFTSFNKKIDISVC